jgi:uncharacterized membrane protein
MRKFKGKTMVIYIPTLTIWLISIMFFIMAIMTTESMRDLGYFVMSMITGIATFITLIATIIISKYRQRKVIK